MNKRLALFAAMLVLGAAAQATVYSVNNLSATIPDGDLNGYQNSISLSGLSGGITHVSVSLNISGGFNGDLYAYLNHGSGASILLNRVGRTGTSSSGYPDAGFGPDSSANIFTLDDQGNQDVHLYRTFAYTLNGSGQLTGQWQPDGRAIDPLSPGSTFDGTSRSSKLNVFNGLDANGTWTLFIADVSPGGVSTLAGWGLQVTTVPEPSIAALLLFGLLPFLFRLWSRSKKVVAHAKLSRLAKELALRFRQRRAGSAITASRGSHSLQKDSGKERLSHPMSRPPSRPWFEGFRTL
jgi:subtilisin-like proprotein convertase family protein